MSSTEFKRHEVTELTEVNEVLLAATITYRLAQGWQVIVDQHPTKNCKRLSSPPGDIRRHWATKWFKCNKLGIDVPWYAMQEDPEVVPEFIPGS